MPTKLSPKAVIFDLGSTLIEYEAVPWDQLQTLCSESARQFLIKEGYDVGEQQEFGRTFEAFKEDYRRTASETLAEWDVVKVAREYLSDAVGESDPALAERFFDAYYKPVDSQLYVYDDTVATLAILKGRYNTIGLVSNTVFPERAHRYELDRFGIERFLTFAVFSSTFGVRKPHRAIFEHSAELAGVKPQECVYIGDRYLEDIQGPSEIGMPAILKIKPGRVYPEEMPMAVRRIDTLSELAEHIEI